MLVKPKKYTHLLSTVVVVEEGFPGVLLITLT